MKITNTQPGPRGVNAVGGAILIDPKQTVDVKVYAREKEGLEASGWFTIEGDYEPDPDATKLPMAGAGDDQSAEIDRLKGIIEEKNELIADLQKKLPETDIDKMTVPELRAHLAYRDVAFDAKKDKKDDLVTLAKAAA